MPVALASAHLLVVRGAHRRVGLRYVLSSPYDAGLGDYGIHTSENPVAA